ncbi:MAG: tetratricopeptide repeat protein [Bacteroidetes bacterium]|nr:tetratricopeptide repeat protein [Bacteroidota bacterium]
MSHYSIYIKLVILTIFIRATTSHAQNYFFSTYQIDSIHNVAKNSSSVVEKAKAHNVLGVYFESQSNYSLAKLHLKNALVISKKHALPKEEIVALNYLGYVFWHESDYDNALNYHAKALTIASQNNIISSDKAFTYLMLGNDHYDLGDYSKTSENYFQALKLFETNGDTTGIIQTHNRLSKLYFKLGDLKNAQLQAKIAGQLNKNTNYIRETAVTDNNFGNIAIEQGKPDSALSFFTTTLLNFTTCGDIIGQSVASINLGDTYLSLYGKNKTSTSLLDSAFIYYNKSYLLNKGVSNKFGMIYGLWGMGDIAYLKGENDKAIQYFNTALTTAVNISAKSEECNLYWKIFESYKAKGDKDNAFLYLEKYATLQKAVGKESQTKALLRQENKYEIEKSISEKNAEIEKEKLLASEKNKWKNIIIIGVLIVAILLGYAVYTSIKRLKIIASKNNLINKINTELTVQRKEITDSITYARRIQEAILPSEKTIKKYLPQSFILYKPKDIVAGDFYWLEEKDDTILIAAAACTGHGVPGAMVSVVCSNALYRSVNEFGLIEPGEILDKTRELVIETFSKSDKDVKDGMDISLASIKR